MAEYIDREVAFDAITDLAGKAPTRSAYEAIWKSARALRKIPAADVVPVVRCKDCQNEQNGCHGTIICRMYKHVMWLHDFCSYGKRKDGGTE